MKSRVRLQHVNLQLKHPRPVLNHLPPRKRLKVHNFPTFGLPDRKYDGDFPRPEVGIACRSQARQRGLLGLYVPSFRLSGDS